MANPITNTTQPFGNNAGLPGYFPSYGQNVPFTGMSYNDPNQTPSSIDVGSKSVQLRTYFYDKLALEQELTNKIFLKIKNSRDFQLPTNHGRELKVYFHPRIIDDRNVNNQGINAMGAQYDNGNFYGSSSDIQTVLSALPVLGETSGQVNRIGMSRKVLSGRVTRLGFMIQVSKEEWLLDTEENFRQRATTQMHAAYLDINEMLTGINLVLAPSLVSYSGAESLGTMTSANYVKWGDLQAGQLALDKAECPTDTDYIFGVNKTDTVTVPNTRFMYTHPYVEPVLYSIPDPLGRPAYRTFNTYGDRVENAMGAEVGQIQKFRIITTQKMPYIKKGTPLQTGGSAQEDLYPLLVVGKNSFGTISVVGENNSTNAEVAVYPPGHIISLQSDPYGNKGLFTIQWWFGHINIRPDHMLAIWTTIPDVSPQQQAVNEKTPFAIVEQAEKLWAKYIASYPNTENDFLSMKLPDFANYNSGQPDHQIPYAGALASPLTPDLNKEGIEADPDKDPSKYPGKSTVKIPSPPTPKTTTPKASG